MGRVAVKFRIMPEGAEVDVKAVEASVRGALGSAVRDVAVHPIAFGLEALEATVVMDDAGGQAEKTEARLREIAGVGEVETLEVSLL